MPRGVPIEDRAEKRRLAARKYMAGGSVQEICSALGVSEGVVRDLLKEANVVMRPPAVPKAIFEGKARVQASKLMRQMYEVDEMSVREIAETYGVSYGFTHQMLRWAGTTFRANHRIAGRLRKPQLLKAGVTP